MGNTNPKKSSESATLAESAPRVREPFLQRKEVLLSMAIAGLILVVGVPAVYFGSKMGDDCNSGNVLIDKACLAEKKRQDEIRLGKNKRINIRPKKEPFGVNERGPMGSLTTDEK